MTIKAVKVFPSRGGGQGLSLNRIVADAGEATVFETDDPALLAKIYHKPSDAQATKIAAMLARPPIDPSLRPGHRSCAWPVDTLLDAEGAFSGFLMPAVPAPHSATAWASPRLRRRAGLSASWSNLHAIAANLAFVIGRLHASDIVIGDLKTDNILVDAHGLVTLIDCDSFQIPRDDGSALPCPVTTEEFCAPELFGENLTTSLRSETADRFSLAVAIFKLLFGASPFAGDWKGGGEPATPAANAAAGRWILGGDPILSPPLAMPDAETVHPDLVKAFDRAFRAGADNPEARPGATSWHEALCLVMAELGVCQADAGHHHYDGAACPWCRQTWALGASPFDTSDDATPPDPLVPLQQAFDRALARGDIRMATDLWDEHDFLRIHASDCTDTIASFRRLLDGFDNWRSRMPGQDSLDPTDAATLLREWRRFGPGAGKLLQWEDVAGHDLASVIQNLRKSATSRKRKPGPAAVPAKERRPVGPLLPGPPTILIREPANDASKNSSSGKPVVTYRIDPGWLDLKPARLTIESAKPVSLPALELIDRLTGQPLVSCPARRLVDRMEIAFTQPVTPTVLILAIALGEKQTVEIKSPPVRHRTIGAPTGPPSPPPHVRKIFVEA